MSSQQKLLLLRRIVKTEFFLRDQGTFLGFFWTLLNPIFLFATLYIVFSRSLGEGTDAFKAYLLTGVLLWNFFSTATSVGASIIARRGGYLANAPLNPALFIIGGVVAVSLTSLCEAVLGFLYLSTTTAVSIEFILHYLTGMAITALLAVGTASFLSLGQIFFADVLYLWGMLLRIGFFLTPVFYTLGSVDIRYAEYLWLNPLTAIFSYARSSLVAAPYSNELLPYIIGASALLTVLGLRLVQTHRHRFIEG